MIRYVGSDHFDDTKADVYAQFTQQGHYHVFARDGLDLDGHGEDVKWIEVFDGGGKYIYEVTHAGIKTLGDKYDVVIFVKPTEVMDKMKAGWERLKDLPGNEDYARTWFEPINKRSEL